MKTINSIFICLGLALIVSTGCKNIENILPSNEGKWNITELSYQSFVGDSLVDEENETYSGDESTFQFNDDGTGEQVEGSDVTDFEWTYNKDREEISLIYFGGLALLFEVLECTKTSLTITTTSEFELFGDIYRDVITYTMVKAE
ncbi:MAG: lipocalin family protein [Bacteroidota bacterium]